MILPNKENLNIIKFSGLLVFLFLTGTSLISTSAFYWNNRPMLLIPFSAVWLMSILLFLIISVFPFSRGKIITSSVIFVLSFIAVTHINIFKENPTIDSAILLWSERSNFDDAFQMYWRSGLSAFIKSAMLAVFILLPSKFTLKSDFKKFRRAAISLLIIIIFIINVFIFTKKNNGVEGMPSQLVLLSLPTATAYAYIKVYGTERKEISIPFNKSDLAHVDNIILIVDESIRADYIDLNSNRDTTPYLLKNKSRIVNFGMATSGHNASNSTNAMIRMGANPSILDEKGGNILFKNPFLWDYAGKSGFKTYYLDCQKDNIYQNFMTEEENASFDNYIRYPQKEMRPYADHSAAETMRKLISEPGRKFIYVNKVGAHFHYNRVYPKDRTVFSPALDTYDDVASNRPKLINSYKNAVRWNVNDFFVKLIDKADLKNTLIIYTSDHGQNLLDDGQPITHGRIRDAIPQEAIVPMFIITDNIELKKKFQSAAEINFNRSSHFQIFPTLLTLMGYNKPDVLKEYYITLFEKNELFHGFFTGNARIGRLNFNPIPDIFQTEAIADIKENSKTKISIPVKNNIN